MSAGASASASRPLRREPVVGRDVGKPEAGPTPRESDDRASQPGEAVGNLRSIGSAEMIKTSASSGAQQEMPATPPVSTPPVSTARSGLVLILTAGVAGVVNAAFSLIFVRLASPGAYSAAAPLLALGSLAALAAAGVEYTATVSIVRSKTASPAIGQALRILAVGLPLLALAPLVTGVLHLSSNGVALLGIALPVITFAAALPSAMLLAYGRVWALGLIAAAEALIRLVAFIPFAHLAPVAASLAISTFVTAAGGLAMAAYALRRGPRNAWPNTTQAPRGEARWIGVQGWIGVSILEIAFYLPFTVPTWLMRNLLPPEQAGVLSLGIFLASGGVMLAGMATSAAVPRATAGAHESELRRGAQLCGGVALLAAVCIWVLGPVVVPILVGHPVQGLRTSLALFALAMPGWALLGYRTWVSLTRGDRVGRYLVAFVLGAGAQTALAITLAGMWSASTGPLLALTVSFVAIELGGQVCRRSKDLPPAEQQQEDSEVPRKSLEAEPEQVIALYPSTRPTRTVANGSDAPADENADDASVTNGNIGSITNGHGASVTNGHGRSITNGHGRSLTDGNRSPAQNGWDTPVDKDGDVAPAENRHGGPIVNGRRATSPVPVSVGVMAYNEAAMIESSLTALLSQTERVGRVDELIVIVSGSTDGTETVVRRIAAEEPRVRLVVEPSRKGKVFAVRRFLDEAKNDLCVIASSDVKASTSCLDHLVAPMTRGTGVGMTGPRVVPESLSRRQSFAASTHRELWDLHHRVASREPKLGELVAVDRRLARDMRPAAGCDEVVLEATVRHNGGALVYVPDAVVHNVGPRSLREYVRQRRRVHAQHIVARRELGYTASTFSVGRGARAALNEMIVHLVAFASIGSAAVFELLGRELGRLDARNGKSHHVWKPSVSAREREGGARAQRS